MSTTIQVRYQKVDQYKNLIFIAKSNLPEELDAFNRITKFHENYKTAFKSFLPMYATETYASLRFKPNSKINFIDNCTYELEFTVRKNTNADGREFINLYINKSKLIKKSSPTDFGELLAFD
jgi:hypothetical protein